MLSSPLRVTTDLKTSMMVATTLNGSLECFVFEDECDGVEIKLSAIFYELDDIKIYYKTRNVGHDGDFNKLNWTPFNPNGVKPGEKRKSVKINEDTDGFFMNNNEYMKTPGMADNIEKIKPRNPIDVDPRRILSSEWQSLTFLHTGCPLI